MQRQGLGRRLVTALLDGLPHERALLTTSARLDDENVLYRLARD